MMLVLGAFVALVLLGVANQAIGQALTQAIESALN